MQEPIVPVSPRGRISAEWAPLLGKLVVPDQVFDVAGLTSEAQAFLSTQLGVQVTPIAMLGPGRWSIFHPLGAHAPDEIVGMQVLLPRRPKLLDWTATGTITDPEEIAQWKQLGAHLVETDDPLALALAQLNGQTVIGKSVHQCGELLAENPWNSSIVWLSEPNSYRDCLEFWDQRSLMSIGFDRELAVLTTPEVFARPEFLRPLTAWLGNRGHTSKPTFVLVSRSISTDTLKDLAGSVGFVVDEGKQMTVSHHFGRRSTEPPAAISVAVNKSLPVSTKVLHGIRTTTKVQMFRDKTNIRTASPLRSHPMYGWGPVRLRLSGLPELQAPRSPSVATLFHRAASWVQGELEIPIDQAPMLNLDIALPTQRSVLDAALLDRGLRAELSPPGRYAQAVLGRLDSAQLFSSVTVARVVEALTGPLSKRLVQELMSQADLSGEQLEIVAARLGPRLNLVAMTTKQIQEDARADPQRLNLTVVVEILDHLSFAGLVHRGLVTECAACGISSFSPLPTVDPIATCPACGSRGRFAGDGTGPQLQYRLNALLDQASANGVLGHLYAVAGLKREDENTYIIAGASIERSDGSRSETDVLAISRDRITSGEVKQSAKRFTPEQVDHDIALSVEIGANRHLMACLEPLPKPITALAARLAAKHGLRLVVLDGTTEELRHIDPAESSS
jgi:hypothetical protein